MLEPTVPGSKSPIRVAPVRPRSLEYGGLNGPCVGPVSSAAAAILGRSPWTGASHNQLEDLLGQAVGLRFRAPARLDQQEIYLEVNIRGRQWNSRRREAEGEARLAASR